MCISYVKFLGSILHDMAMSWMTYLLSTTYAFSSTLKCFDVSVSVPIIRGGLELHVCLDSMCIMVTFHYLVIIIRGWYS